MTTSIKREVNDIVNSLACPRELISYSRKIRSLDEIGQFKANEFFNWMFYVSPVVFRKCIPGTLYESFIKLVFGVRLLLESSRENDILLSENLLNQFCSNIVDIFDGNKRSATINVHSLRHLPDQVRRFGPLFAFVAMSFESANRILSEIYSGTHHECDVICRRFLQKQRLLDLHQDREQNQFSGLVKQLLHVGMIHTQPIFQLLCAKQRVCIMGGLLIQTQSFSIVFQKIICISIHRLILGRHHSVCATVLCVIGRQTRNVSRKYSIFCQYQMNRSMEKCKPVFRNMKLSRK